MTKPDTSHYETCRKRLIKHENRRKRYLFFTVVLAFANVLFMTIMAATQSLFLAIPALLLTILAAVGTLVIFVLADESNRHLMKWNAAVLGAAAVLQVMNPIIVILIGIICFQQYRDYEKLDALKEFDGYPFFNERYTQQKNASDLGYEAPYDISKQGQGAKMQDVYDAILTQTVQEEGI